MSVFNRVLGFVVAAAVLTACQPAPRRLLTTEEKIADLHWVFSQFNENYAPLTYKESLHTLDFNTLKQKYLAEAPTTTTNEEFYTLMHRFVSEFKDAHTASNLLASGASPGRVTVASLGFSARRNGIYAVVTALLPTTQATSRFPIAVGDRIRQFDGNSIEDATLELSKFRNLGNKQADVTFQVPKLFLRQSISVPMPANPDAILTVVRRDSQGRDYEVKITLPWVKKDLVQFTLEQVEAKKKAEKDHPLEQTAGLTGAEWSTLFKLGAATGGAPGFTPTVLQNITHAISGKSFWNSFVFLDYQPEWTSQWLKESLYTAARELKVDDELQGSSSQDPTPAAKFAAVRDVPRGVIWVNEAKTYPTYVHRRVVFDASGMPNGQKKLVATMLLDTFSPATGEPEVVKEVAATLQVLEGLGVEDVVIDLINNGGGSLELGSKIAQLFSNQKILLPDMQFALNETWLDEFENRAIAGPSDTEREIARRVFDVLKAEHARGARLSSRFNIEALAPYAFPANLNLKKGFNVVLLVNEMCASMCDIFAATLQDNGLATVVGDRTMGAGGNVVQIPGMAPNSNLYLNQTESLILRKDGSYIENNGVTPDVAMNVNATSGEKYAPVRERALEQLFGKSAMP
jgi:C-terminal processing protease CtpA/Prc